MTATVEAAWIAAAGGFIGVLTGVTGTVIVAVRGFRSTQLATEQTTNAGTANVQAQIEADREARRRDRLHEAYLEVGIFLTRWSAWANSVQSGSETVAPAEPVTQEEQWRADTLVRLYCSSKVMDRLGVWAQHRQNVASADKTIRRWKASPAPSSDVAEEARKEELALAAYKKAMATAAAEVEGQMRWELRRG